MPVNVKSLIDAQYVPNATTTLFTAETDTQITAASATNVSAGIADVTVYIVPAAGAADGGNQVVKAQRIAVNESYQMPELQGQALGVGDSIQAVASGSNSINIRVSGVEFT